MTKANNKSFSRLYRKISTLFVVILFLFAVVTLYISVQSAKNYSFEVNQNMNRDLAANLTYVQ